METLRDLLDEIRLGLTERITSPLLGTYIVSWLICNYRVLMTIFGDGTTAQKFSMLTVQMYGGSWHWHFLYTFFWPAALTAFYIWVYPKLAKPVYERRLKNLREMTAIRQKEENEQLLSVEASIKLREQNRELKQELVTRQKDAEQVIDDLQKLLTEERKKGGGVDVKDYPSNESKKREFESAEREQNKDKLNKESRDGLLKLITLSLIASMYGDQWVSLRIIVDALVKNNTLGLSQLAARALLDQLVKMHLIEYNSDESQLTITKSARQYVVEEGLDMQKSFQNLMSKYKNNLYNNKF